MEREGGWVELFLPVMSLFYDVGYVCMLINSPNPIPLMSSKIFGWGTAMLVCMDIQPPLTFPYTGGEGC